MAEVLGAVAACDQLAVRFTSLYKQLRMAYKIMRHAGKDIKEMKSRTEILKKLWRFFGKTMKKVSRIQEFSVDLKQYRDIDKALQRQSWTLSRKIGSIISILRPILEKDYTSAWTELRVRLEWLFRNREELRLLHVDMDLLTQYMGIFSNLVQVQISVHQFNVTQSAATKTQIEVLGDNIKIALEGIRQAQKNQESRLPPPEDWQKQVRKEVKRLLRQDMSHMKMAVADSDTSSGPSSGLSPPGPSPSTPLTTPSSQPNSPIRDPSINEQPSRPSSFLSEHTSPRTNQPSAAHATFSLDSEVSYVSGHQDSTTNSGAGLHPPLPTVKGEEDDEVEIEGEGQGIYMPTPLFGPPIPRSRVPNARVSTASLNHDHRISSISPPNKSRKESRSRAHDANTSPRPSTDRHVK